MEVDETVWSEQKATSKLGKMPTKIPTKIPVKSPTASKPAGRGISKIPSKLPTKVLSTASSNVMYKTGSNIPSKHNSDALPSCNTSTNRWQHQTAISNQQSTEQVVFGDLDCNDNTPVVNQDSLTIQQDSLLSSNPTSSVQSIGQYSVNSCDLTCDLASDLPCDSVSLNPSTSSTCSVVEDNSNNEFFYDDEFTVPFDAHLDAGDKFDTQSLLTLAQGEYNIHGGSMSDDDVDSIDEFFLNCLTTSKSDSCLYQLELNTSNASNNCMYHSHNQPYSQQEELISSADFSRVCRDKPLFTSSYADSVELKPHKYLLSSHNPASVDSLGPAVNSMNGSSLVNSMEQYSYDWTANKDRYTLLFDKSSNRVSDDDASSGQESMHSGHTNWTDRSQHSTLSAPIKLQNPSNGNNVMPGKSYARQQSLTSWGEMKKDKIKMSPSEPVELTSWKNVQNSQAAVSSSEGSLEMKASSTKSIGKDSVYSDRSDSDNDSTKRHSGTLLQIYQRLKSPDAAEVIADMEASNTVSVSSEALQKMIGTWSVSPCSDRSQLWTSDDTNNDVPLSSWNTHKNLTTYRRCTQDSVSGESVDLGESYLNSTATSEGSYQLSDAGQPSFEQQSSRDASVQTSQIQKKPANVRTVNKSLQTSLVRHESRPTTREDHSKSRRRPRAKSLDESTEDEIKSIDKVFYPNATLPDLSFLNSATTNTKVFGSGFPGKQNPKEEQVERKPTAINGNNVRSPKIMRSKTTSSLTTATRSRKNVTGVKTGLPSLPSVERLRHKASFSSLGSCSSTSSGIDAGFSESPPVSDTTLNSTLDTTMSSTNSPRVSPPRSGSKQRGTSPKKSQNEACKFAEYRSKNVQIPAEIGENCKCCQLAMPMCRTATMTHSQPIYAENESLHSNMCANELNTRLSAAHLHYLNKYGHNKQVPMMLQHPHTRGHCCAHAVNSLLINRDLLRKQPLKSCLVKRRRTSRGGRMVKHRSFSDPHDLSVMKYSLEGQARYQLLAPHCQQRCIHSLSADTEPHIQKSHTQTHTPLKQTREIQTNTPPVIHEENHDLQREIARHSPPQSIPIIPCQCKTRNVKQGGNLPSSQYSENVEDGEETMKKCVSFSENISYHSPSNTPQVSPNKHTSERSSTDEHSCVSAKTDGRSNHTSKRHEGFIPITSLSRDIDRSLSDMSTDSDEPPTSFYVSPSGVDTCTSYPDMQTKKDLLSQLEHGCQALITYINSAVSTERKVMLCNSALNIDIGHFILKQLCPMIYAVLADGLRTNVRSLFGKMKNCVWNVVEATATQGPTSRLFHEILHDLKSFDFLTTPWLKFNAFIFALLNHHVLDYWVRYLYSDLVLLQKHYNNDSFMILSATSYRSLCSDFIVTLQPLAHVPFRLEYNFEFRIIQQEQQKHLVTYMLDKHTAFAQNAVAMAQNITHHGAMGMPHSAMGMPQNMTSITNVPHSYGGSTSYMVPMTATGGAFTPGPTITSTTSDRAQQIKQTSRRLITKLWSSVDTTDSADSTGCKERSSLEREQAKQFITAEPQPVKVHSVKPEPMRAQIFSDVQPMGFQKSAEATPIEIQTPYQPLVESATVDQDNKTNEGILSRVVKQFKGSQENLRTSAENITRLFTDYHQGHRSSSHERSSSEPPPDRGQSDSGVDCYTAKNESVRALDDNSLPARREVNKQDPQKRWSDSETLNKTQKSEPATKRWSSFGPNLINVFDKLLLGGNQKMKLSDTKMKRSQTTGSVSTQVKNQPMKALPLKPADPSDACSSSGDKLLSNQNAAISKVELKPRRTHSLEEKSTEENYVQALCHYLASDDEQLSLQKGKVLKVVDTLDSDWLLCRYGSQEGKVHKACVEKADKSEG